MHVIGLPKGPTPRPARRICQGIQGDGTHSLPPGSRELNQWIRVGGFATLLHLGWDKYFLLKTNYCNQETSSNKITPPWGNCQLCSMHFTIPLVGPGVDPWGKPMTCAYNYLYDQSFHLKLLRYYILVLVEMALIPNNNERPWYSRELHWPHATHPQTVLNIRIVH